MPKITDTHKTKIRKKVSNRRKTKQFARPDYPDTIVLEYGKAIIREVNQIDKLIKEIIFPQLNKITDTKSERLDSTIRLDLELKNLAGVALVAELIRRVKSKFYGQILGTDESPNQRLFTRSVRRMANNFMVRTKDFGEKKFSAEFKRQTGTEPLPRNLDVQEFVKDATLKNVALIKTIPERYLSQVQTLTEEAVNKGQLTRELKEELLKIKEASKNHARLIARDQVSKLVGVTNEARQKNLGVTEYIWKTMNDSRVRSLSNTNGTSDHAHLEGTLQKWSKPPVVVFKGKRSGVKLLPSQDFQCRCFASPVYDDITGIEHPSTKAARKKSVALGIL